MLGELYQSTGAAPELFHKFMMNSSADMSKASRRKQSKPNRLIADEEGGPPLPSTETQISVHSAMEQLPSSQAENETNDKIPMDLSSKAENRSEDREDDRLVYGESSPTPMEAEDGDGDMQIVNFPCHTCGEVFSSRSLQEQHILERHNHEGSEAIADAPGPIFPTAYHRLATELGLGPLGLISNLSSGKSGDSSKSLAALANGGSVPKSGTPGVGGKGTAGTVFQREAYCEICQREFCNKYFLKTHKANIHGIVDPNDPKAAAVVSKISQPPKLTQSTSSESLMLQKLSSAPGVKASTMDNMDDFCEICQKHFCNKYYLKKHKVDVHNIRPDASCTKLPSNENPNDGRSSMSSSIPTTSSLSLQMMVPALSNLNSSNMLFVNPFMPNMAAMSMVPPMMQPQFFMHGVGGLAAHAASQMSSHASSISPDMKKERQSTPSSDKDDSTSQGEKAEAFCNLCKKEFCNTYFLQVHRASKHGIFEDPAASALMLIAAEREKMEREILKSTSSPSPPVNTIRPVVITSDKERPKTSPAFALNNLQSMPTSQALGQPVSFDAMLAAKQADRIVCDICNKEVCNKYFLKAHKLKMHGISSPVDDKSVTPAKDFENNKKALLSLYEQQQGMQETTPESLLKIGIDPEAYCFLCKKEFCSKYFLRTHKLNIHGIKSEEGLQQTPPKGTITPPTSVSPAPNQMLSSQPSMNNNDTFQAKWKDQQMKGMSGSINDVRNGESEKFTWRWKETSNTSRVFCDICNKELCNKYFLRTHKFKIHGICDQTSPPRNNSRTMMASNLIADLARVSQMSLHNQNVRSSPNGQNMISNLHNSRGQQSPFSESDVSSQSATDRAEAMRDDVCQVCGMVFSDTEAVNDHMKLDHPDECLQMMFPKTESKVYSCSQCTYKTTVLSNIFMHESRKHNTEMNTCKICQVTFSHIHMLVKHMHQIHGKAISAKTAKGANRRVQCNFCNERFLTRKLCQSHIRYAHALKSSSGLRANRSSFECDKCSYTCTSYRNLKIHKMMRHKSHILSSKNDVNNKHGISKSYSSNYVMQEFTIKSSEIDQLATNTINLPVFNKVKDRMQFNLTLIPSSNTEESPAIETTTS